MAAPVEGNSWGIGEQYDCVASPHIATPAASAAATADVADAVLVALVVRF